MAQNLNHKTHGSWCYNDDDSKCKQYGRLYYWKAAMAACPSGWHLPTRREWADLVTAAGGGNMTGRALKSMTDDWAADDHRDGIGGNGIDGYGFSALPGGWREIDANYSSGDFSSAGFDGYWWTATENNEREAYGRSIYFNNTDVKDSYFTKGNGNSVRCVQGDNNGSGGKPSDSARQKKETDERQTEARRRIENLSDYFTDTRDGKKYRAVKIGGKKWMAQNLNYETLKSWCYNNDDSNCAQYGGLYYWETATNACPAGWHLPSRQEWDDLATAAGGKKLKAVSGWNHGGNGSDEYGFSALPGGYRYSDGNFISAGYNGYWWTATVDGGYYAYYRRMFYDDDDIPENSNFKNFGFSVRCLQDD